MKDFSENELRSKIYNLEDRRDEILSKMSLLSKEEEQELNSIKENLRKYSLMLRRKDGSQ